MLKTLQYILMYILACTLTRQEEDDNVEVSFESRWYDCTQDAEACYVAFLFFFSPTCMFQGKWHLPSLVRFAHKTNSYLSSNKLDYNAASLTM